MLCFHALCTKNVQDKNTYANNNNSKICRPYSPPNVIKVIKSMRMRRAETEEQYITLQSETVKEKDHLGDVAEIAV
jgi:hypothetical protein